VAESPLRGQCLCGAIRVSVAQWETDLWACQCTMCRRWGSGPLFGIIGQGATFESEDHLGIYPSSHFAERGFCLRCGTHLFFRFQGRDGYGFSLGLFPQLSHVAVGREIFVDERAGYCRLASRARQLTSAQARREFNYPADSDRAK